MASEDMEAQLKEFSNFIKFGWNAAKDIQILDNISNIVTCGMGGSGIPGSLIKSYVNIPITCVRDYQLPAYIDKKALVFIVSYSGNTEEAIACFRSAMGIGCKIIGITSGGKLKELCEKSKLDCIDLPKGLQPRSGVPLMFFPILRLLQNSQLIENQQEKVDLTIETLSQDMYEDMGKALSHKLKGKIPVIYSSQKLEPVAYRWRTQFNENAKTLALHHVFPELNHNEIVGYEKVNGDYYVLIIEDEGDHPRIKKRMKLTKKLIAEHGVSSTVVALKGTCLLSRMMSAIHIGDWAAYYLALLNEVDPTPVKIIEELKKEMK